VATFLLITLLQPKKMSYKLGIKLCAYTSLLGITAIDYDKYAKKYNDEKIELERKLVEYTNNDKSFVVTSSYLLQLASKAKEVFESSQPEKKNKILKMLLANCQNNQKRLQLNLLKPFDGLLSAMKSQNWLPQPDSNQVILPPDI
jgi:hypothetical protein